MMKLWLSSTFIDFLIISLFKFMCYFMCVYRFGRFTFNRLGQVLLLWFIVCFFTLKYCYLLLSLFISITIIFTIITLTIINYIVVTFQFFNTLTTHI